VFQFFLNPGEKIVVVNCAEEHRKQLKEEHDRKLQARVLVAMNGQLRPWAISGHSDKC